jgi:hypothetical protein
MFFRQVLRRDQSGASHVLADGDEAVCASGLPLAPAHKRVA